MVSVLGVYFGDMVVPPKPSNAIRIVCQSDTHSQLEKNADLHLASIPSGDIYIHTGDFTSTGTLKQIQDFESFVSKLPHRHKIVIAGNHDITLDQDYYKKSGSRFHRLPQVVRDCRDVLIQSRHLVYLEDSGVEILGIKIWGSPWQPEFCDWAFNLDRNSDAIRSKWDLIPLNTDVLLTHGPPMGHGGMCSDGVDAGCEDLLMSVKKVKPAVHVFGHIHEAYGVSEEDGTVFINASTCTLSYRPTNPPVVFDVKNEEEEPGILCLTKYLNPCFQLW